ncbi:MFS transporter [Undibacterium pigrum]|uniref:EmrB/QacA subfamily drug resistance transporter n=1 Tax=Undibacterium pigrum TaxID=401470 RepID=A0A318J1Q1_9BURK|nr:MFS transporter [Undibacterium pigrum]PXX41525.1 EmrB/QacA subfamily drug resistance transporter [Undibacterium pigrum]
MTTHANSSKVRWILASLSLSMLLSSLGTSIANVGLPTLTHAFNASFQQVQWVVIAYLLAITTLIVSVGRLGDLMGRKRLLLAGIALFSIASMLCAAAPTLHMLIAARALQGLGAAIMMALTMAFVSETVSKEKTGSAMGLLGTMSAVGTALGPSLGGILIASLHWRSIFFINVPLGIASFLLAQRYLPPDQQASNKASNKASPRFDHTGTLLLALSLAAYALAMTLGRGHFGAINLALLLAAMLGAALFIVVETKVASPLIRPAMFRDITLSTSLGMNILVATVMMATLVVGPFYLSRALALSDAMVGLVMSTGPVISACSGVIAGRIVDRLGAQATVIAGLVAMTAGAFALALLPALLGIAGYIIAISILTPGYQLFQAANNTAVMQDIQTSQRGLVSGMLNLSRNLGLITGATLMGAVFARASASSDIRIAAPEAIATGMQMTFIVAGVMLVIALLIAGMGRLLSMRTENSVS